MNFLADFYGEDLQAISLSRAKYVPYNEHLMFASNIQDFLLMTWTHQKLRICTFYRKTHKMLALFVVDDPL
jgi:hypothetical protein